MAERDGNYTVGPLDQGLALISMQILFLAFKTQSYFKQGPKTRNKKLNENLSYL